MLLLRFNSKLNESTEEKMYVHSEKMKTMLTELDENYFDGKIVDIEYVFR